MFLDRLFPKPDDWPPPPMVVRHVFQNNYCVNCRVRIDAQTYGTPCVIETVGIACSDCGAPVYFPSTAPNLELYQMIGTRCHAHWTP